MDITSKSGGNFSSIYPQINEVILKHGEDEPSRYGDTKEILGFKTVTENPIARCVGGQKRDVNIFFLLAEAVWIFAGRKDVEFLTIFNSRMGEFSDDGKVFHAPYGFRLRHWDTPSNATVSVRTEQNKHAFKEDDQIRRGLELLGKDSETRRCVLSIWNADFDLFSTTPTKDIPCNDLLMFKIRKEKLHLSVLNRSNDLHWGLPTNMFQFSFILEVMARMLKVEVGAERHFSDSLHIYTNNDNNKIHEKMTQEWNAMNQTTLYDLVEPSKMDIEGFSLEMVDKMFNRILTRLSFDAEISTVRDSGDYELGSQYFDMVYAILRVYVEYTKTERKDEHRLSAICQLCHIQGMVFPTLGHDYIMLALNWFHSRLKTEDAVQASRSEIEVLKLVPELSNIDYSYVGRL